MRPVSILATGAYLPERRVSNDDLSERLPQTSDEWIFTHTGIRYRHIVDDEQSTSDLAFHAAEQALQRAGVAPEELGMILVATSSPDYANFPSTACVIQSRLGAMQAGASDISAACTGYIYGLEFARGLAQADDRPILVVGAETISRILDWDDHETCVLFGDGAGASVVQASDIARLDTSAAQVGIVDSFLGADGSGGELLRREGGTRRPFDPARDGVHHTIQMQGKAVFNFAVRAISQVIEHFIEKHQLKTSDIAHIVPHQANDRIIQAAVKRLDIPKERYYINLDRVANTSGASIPIALSELEEQGKLRRGDVVITVGFGGGLTYGGNLIYW